MNRMPLSPQADHVMSVARVITQKKKYDVISRESVLLAILDFWGGAAILILKGIGVNTEVLRKDIWEFYKKIPKGDVSSASYFSLAVRVQSALTCAEDYAASLGCRYVGTQHIFFAFLHQDDSLKKLCEKHGFNLEKFDEEIKKYTINNLNKKMIAEGLLLKVKNAIANEMGSNSSFLKISGNAIPISPLFQICLSVTQRYCAKQRIPFDEEVFQLLLVCSVPVIE